MATKKEFEKLRERLRVLKSEQSEIQALYEERANQRLGYQNKMAALNLMLQNRSLDTMLIEDVVVVTLVAENNARQRYSLMPPAPTKTPIQVQPGQKTKSLDEACNVYRSQIEVLEEMIEYRRTLTAADRDLDLLYRHAVDDILDVMEEYCSDEKLKGDMLSFSLSGSAPCSPRKEKKKGVFSRIGLSPGSLFSPKKGMTKDSMRSELLPEPVSVESASSPKRAFANFKANAQFKELHSAPLLDLSENDNNQCDENTNKDTHDFENDDAETDQEVSTDPVERRKQKKNNRMLRGETGDAVETESDEENTTTMQQNSASDTGVSSATNCIEKDAPRDEATNSNLLNASTETEPIEKKKKKKNKKKEGFDGEPASLVEKTEAVDTASGVLTDVVTEKKKKKKMKKLKSDNGNEPVHCIDTFEAEHVVVAKSPPDERNERTTEKIENGKQVGTTDDNELSNFEPSALGPPNDDEVPAEKKKKATKSKSTDDDDSPLPVDDGLIANSQESTKKKTKKKLKVADEGENVEVLEKTQKKEKKKKKKKEEKKVKEGSNEL